MGINRPPSNVRSIGWLLGRGAAYLHRMDIGEIFYPPDRASWRAWLTEHHASRKEIWLRRFCKASGRPSISYDDLVEECLCFGWIDGISKKLDAESHVQRMTPRRVRGSFLSELNRQRIWKLQRLGLMTPAGIAPISAQIGDPGDPFEIPGWIVEALQEEAGVWDRFESFPRFYRRLKIGWITEPKGEAGRAEAKKRLQHLVRMTASGKRYGTEPLASWEE